MSRVALMAISALVGASGALLAVASTSAVAAPPVAGPMQPGPTQPGTQPAQARRPPRARGQVAAPAPVYIGNKFKITCPDHPPTAVSWAGGWQEITWGGNFAGSGSTGAAGAGGQSEFNCLYEDPRAPGTAYIAELSYGLPTGLKNCANSSDGKSLICDQS